MTKRPIEADYTSHVAYTRPLEAYCDGLEQKTSPSDECLSQPAVEPVAEVVYLERGGNAGIATRIVEIDSPHRERLQAGTKLYAEPQAQPVQEPVAYIHMPKYSIDGKVRPVVSFERYEDDYAADIYSERIPLFTAPQVQEKS